MDRNPTSSHAPGRVAHAVIAAVTALGGGLSCTDPVAPPATPSQIPIPAPTIPAPPSRSAGEVRCEASVTCDAVGHMLGDAALDVSCSAPTDADPHLYLDDILLDCAGELIALPLGRGAGALYDAADPPRSPLRNAELDLAAAMGHDPEGTPTTTLSLRLALALELTGRTGCSLRARVGATEGPLSGACEASPSRVRTALRIDQPLIDASGTRLACAASSRVTMSATPPRPTPARRSTAAAFDLGLGMSAAGARLIQCGPEAVDLEVAPTDAPRVVSLPRGGGDLSIPTGAVDDDVAITVTGPFAPPEDVEALTPLYRFGPEGARFERPLRVRFPAPTADASEAVIYWTRADDPTRFEALPTERVDGHWVAWVDHFSGGFVGRPAVCGNGRREPSEACDIGVGVQTCFSATAGAKHSGVLACDEACELDTNGCLDACPPDLAYEGTIIYTGPTTPTGGKLPRHLPANVDLACLTEIDGSFFAYPPYTVDLPEIDFVALRTVTGTYSAEHDDGALAVTAPLLYDEGALAASGASVGTLSIGGIAGAADAPVDITVRASTGAVRHRDVSDLRITHPAPTTHHDVLLQRATRTQATFADTTFGDLKLTDYSDNAFVGGDPPAALTLGWNGAALSPVTARSIAIADSLNPQIDSGPLSLDCADLTFSGNAGCLDLRRNTTRADAPMVNAAVTVAGPFSLVDQRNGPVVRPVLSLPSAAHIRIVDNDLSAHLILDFGTVTGDFIFSGNAFKTLGLGAGPSTVAGAFEGHHNVLPECWVVSVREGLAEPHPASTAIYANGPTPTPYSGPYGPTCQEVARTHPYCPGDALTTYTGNVVYTAGADRNTPPLDLCLRVITGNLVAKPPYDGTLPRYEFPRLTDVGGTIDLDAPPADFVAADLQGVNATTVNVRNMIGADLALSTWQMAAFEGLTGGSIDITFRLHNHLTVNGNQGTSIDVQAANGRGNWLIQNNAALAGARTQVTVTGTPYVDNWWIIRDNTGLDLSVPTARKGFSSSSNNAFLDIQSNTNSWVHLGGETLLATFRVEDNDLTSATLSLPVIDIDQAANNIGTSAFRRNAQLSTCWIRDFIATMDPADVALILLIVADNLNDCP